MNTTIYSISESPRAAGQIWVGTDDGNVQLTRDGGRNWANVTANLSACPQGNWISWVEASRYNPAVAYVTNDRHTYGDMPALSLPHRRLWTDLAAADRARNAGRSRLRPCHQGRPAQSQHPLPRDRVRICTSASNGGRSWAQFKPNNFPDGLAVRDIALQEREDDLVLATHGRGIWVIDDVSPLRQLTPRNARQHRRSLFQADPVEQRIQGYGGWAEGDATYLRRQSAERRDHHLLPKGAARDRPDEARDPRFVAARWSTKSRPPSGAASTGSTGRC